MEPVDKSQFKNMQVTLPMRLSDEDRIVVDVHTVYARRVSGRPVYGSGVMYVDTKPNSATEKG